LTPLRSVAYNDATFRKRAGLSPTAHPVSGDVSGDLRPGGFMNKQEVVAKIAKDTGITKTAAAGAVESIIDGITRSLKKGNPVSFVGFGTFKISNRKARTARNPQTGAAIKIPKRRVPRFSAGKALKQAVR
jgi:nucleoid DNA-binding protein